MAKALSKSEGEHPLALPPQQSLAPVGLGAKTSRPAKARDVDYVTDINAANMARIPSGSHWILWSTVIFIAVAVVWASVARVDEVTVGMGSVIPSSKVQVVQNLEGGILSELLVREGDVVTQNQPILRLDDTRFSSSYRESRVNYLGLLAKQARLQAESQGTELEIPEIVLSEQPIIAKNEQDLYQSRQHELQSTLSILTQQQSQKEQELLELKSKISRLNKSYNLIKQELSISEPLVREGAISEVEILQLKRKLNDVKGELDTSELAIPRINASLRESKDKLEEAKIQFQTEALAEQNEIKAKLSAMDESNKALEDQVTRTLVRSPVHGTIKQLKITTIGGVVQPGMDLVEIVPLEDTLLVEAKIRPADIAFVRPGQEAMVKITAYDYSIYGGLKGELEHISADTIDPEKYSEAKNEAYYLIKVRTEKSYLGTEANPLEIIPGMTAEVDIKTGQKTILDYVLKPILKSKERALRER